MNGCVSHHAQMMVRKKRIFQALASGPSSSALSTTVLWPAALRCQSCEDEIDFADTQTMRKIRSSARKRIVNQNPRRPQSGSDTATPLDMSQFARSQVKIFGRLSDSTFG